MKIPEPITVPSVSNHEICEAERSTQRAGVVVTTATGDERRRADVFGARRERLDHLDVDVDAEARPVARHARPCRCASIVHSGDTTSRAQ